MSDGAKFVLAVFGILVIVCVVVYGSLFFGAYRHAHRDDGQPKIDTVRQDTGDAGLDCWRVRVDDREYLVFKASSGTTAVPHEPATGER